MPSLFSSLQSSSDIPGSPEAGSHESPFWIVLGDIHNAISRLCLIPERMQAAGIIVTGDLTLGGHRHQAQRVMEALLRCHPAVYAQIGNMDHGDITDWLSERHWNTHREVRPLLPQLALMGLGGSTPTPFGSPSEFSEEQYAQWLEELWLHAENFRHVVLSTHTPPRNTRCDRTGRGVHAGSAALRAFLEKAQPDVCLCGHIHESRALDRLGRTLLVNPGAFMEGDYATLRLEGDHLSATLHSLPV